MNKKRHAAASVGSFVLSFAAASHHWLHMAILLVLGGSTNMMKAMSTMVWVRRIMIVATLITTLITV